HAPATPDGGPRVARAQFAAARRREPGGVSLWPQRVFRQRRQGLVAGGLRKAAVGRGASVARAVARSGVGRVAHLTPSEGRPPHPHGRTAPSLSHQCQRSWGDLGTVTPGRGTEMDTSNDKAIQELIGADLRDSLEEELELELDDRVLDEFKSAKPTNGGYEEL